MKPIHSLKTLLEIDGATWQDAAVSWQDSLALPRHHLIDDAELSAKNTSTPSFSSGL